MSTLLSGALLCALFTLGGCAPKYEPGFEYGEVAKRKLTGEPVQILSRICNHEYRFPNECLYRVRLVDGQDQIFHEVELEKQ